MLIMIMHEPSVLLTAILFRGILIAVPFSALAQQQLMNITTSTKQQHSPQSDSMNEDNKALIRSFIEEIFNEHNMSEVYKYYAQDLYNTIHK